MGSLLYARSLSRSLSSHPAGRSLLRPLASPLASAYGIRSRRRFHSSPVPWGVKPQVLKDVGEGITEVQIIQWYVEEGARIEEWKPLCQYQSDKAVDDITSRYDGVIKKLHFQPDDTVPTGMALCDIEVDDALYPENNVAQGTVAAAPETPSPKPQEAVSQAAEPEIPQPEQPQSAVPVTPKAPSKYATFATPAVRGLLKEHNVDITLVQGTGKDGRVMKEDMFKYIAERDAQATAASTTAAAPSAPAAAPSLNTPQQETTQALGPIQSQMFKTMTKSLTIPHFLYADELNIANLSAVRTKLNTQLLKQQQQKLSYLPFIVKAVSLSLLDFPLLNARVDTTTNPKKPSLIMRSNHNIGVAMDTPTGLLVPNIKNVQARSITDIAAELARLGELAKAGKLTPADLNGGTITVSNIGSIGGTYVAPVLVPSEVAILGVGKARTTPVFDEEGNVAKGQLMNFSWSADHRVIDGATMARMAVRVTDYLEAPESMMLALR